MQRARGAWLLAEEGVLGRVLGAAGAAGNHSRGRVLPLASPVRC